MRTVSRRYRPLPAGIKKILTRKFRVPDDLSDLYCNWSSWKKTFHANLGILLLLVCLKFPSSRKFFAEAYASSRVFPGPYRVYQALVSMAVQFAHPAVYKVLRTEIDAIKGPSKVHGMCIYLQRLGVVKASRGKYEGIRLGAGEKRFVIAKYNAGIERRIQSYLDMHSTLATMKVAWTVATYAKNETHVLDGMTLHRPVQLATPSENSYHREWTYRCYQLAEGRTHGVQRLRYYPHDTVANLPGPDSHGKLPKLGLKRPLSDLYRVQHVSVCPEYVSAALCLGQGRFKENRSARSKARISGRCKKCQENHRSSHYCRHQMRHTAPAAC